MSTREFTPEELGDCPGGKHDAKRGPWSTEMQSYQCTVCELGIYPLPDGRWKHYYERRRVEGRPV